jgi:hypothetical protein
LGFAIKTDDAREKERAATSRKATLVLGAKADAEVRRAVESMAIVFIVGATVACEKGMRGNAMLLIELTKGRWRDSHIG